MNVINKVTVSLWLSYKKEVNKFIFYPKTFDVVRIYELKMLIDVLIH